MDRFGVRTAHRDGAGRAEHHEVAVAGEDGTQAGGKVGRCVFDEDDGAIAAVVIDQSIRAGDASESIFAVASECLLDGCFGGIRASGGQAVAANLEARAEHRLVAGDPKIDRIGATLLHPSMPLRTTNGKSVADEALEHVGRGLTACSRFRGNGAEGLAEKGRFGEQSEEDAIARRSDSPGALPFGKPLALNARDVSVAQTDETVAGEVDELDACLGELGAERLPDRGRHQQPRRAAPTRVANDCRGDRPPDLALLHLDGQFGGESRRPYA